MSISIVIISLLVTFGLTTTSAQAEERLPFRATFSGTFVKTQFDTNGDGAPANLNFLEGESNLGQFSLQVLDESVLAEPTTCPNGHPGFSVTLVAGSAVFRFRGTGDLVFVQPTSQTTCFDPSTGVGFFPCCHWRNQRRHGTVCQCDRHHRRGGDVTDLDNRFSRELFC
jgi:hypothetical protein